MSLPEGREVGDLAGFHYRYDRPAACDAPGGDGWTLLLLHGTGGDETQLTGLGRQLLQGAAQLSPRGNVSEGGAPRFFARLALNRFDPAEVERGADALAGFVRAAAVEHGIDLAKTVAVGYSNGANVALAAMQRHPGLLRGAVLLRAMLVLDPEAGDPLNGVDLLALGGERDPLIDATGYARLVEVTRDQGATVQAHVERGVGHDLGPGDVATATAWLSTLTQAT
ncbi:MAG: alpha/beta hydrolase [Solirubrobacteraceae bacterium]|nr:alpha/beta hydrolase [Patulibacter sp.]